MSELPEPAPLPGERAGVITLGRSERDLVVRLAAAAALGCRRVVVDVGDAAMLEGSTLAALHRTGARLRGRGGELTVVATSAALARLLRLTMLSEGFSVVGSRAEVRGRRARAARVAQEPPAAGQPFDVVAPLVAAGVGSRAGLGTDASVELQLALEQVLGSSEGRGQTGMAVQESDEDLQVEIGPVTCRDSGRELERVVSTIVKAVETRSTGQNVWISMRVLPTPPSRAQLPCRS